ncbi:hypothetical protein Tco_1230607 [Tanacetum coccineum]
MVEPKPTSKNPIKAQIARDEEIAQKLFEEEQAQFEREQMIAKEKAAEQEAKDAALIDQMEDVQARMDADALLATRLQEEEIEQFSIDEQAKFLVETIVARKKFFVAQRAAEIRNRPPTRTQLRNQMITYLKHMGKYTHNQLKNKSFEEIQKLYKKAHQWIDDFVPMDSEEGGKKRQRTNSVDENVKRQKIGEASNVDDDDTLWKFQRYMHDPLVWRLYDACGVHYVSSVRGHDIFMLVEIDYPLSKGVLMLILVNKLLVEQPSEMANELLRKIFIQAKRPRHFKKLSKICQEGINRIEYRRIGFRVHGISRCQAITDQIAGTLPSDMVKNPKLGTHQVLSACSYPIMNPQCSTQIHSSINAITIHPKQQIDTHDRTKENEEEERGNSENHPDSPTPPDPSISFVTEKVLKFNSLFESLRLVPPSPNAELVCTKEENGDVMFIEIIPKDDNSHREGPEAGVQEVEYFDMFPTRSELAKLDPRENINGGISNFTGRIKGMHVFVGNFTYVVDFMIVEDISSIIDPRLSQVVLGRPFIEISNMTHDLPEGVVRFTNENDEVAYKMPHKIEQYNSLSNLEKEHTKSVYLRNEEDKRRGVDYVISKILGFYKECLELGPEYVNGLDDEGEVM